MLLNNKVAVHVLGCHVAAPNYEELVWGDGPFGAQKGRLALAVRKVLALQKLNLMVQLRMGTGVIFPDGTMDCERLLQVGLEAVQSGQESLRDILHGAVLDRTTQNTTQEIAEALRWCGDAGFDRLVLVTNPFHAPRAVREALVLKNSIGEGVDLEFACADTDLAGGGVELCVTAEPPHRGDDWQLAADYPPELRRHVLEARTVKGFFGKKLPFARDWHDLLQRHGV